MVFEYTPQNNQNKLPKILLNVVILFFKIIENHILLFFIIGHTLMKKYWENMHMAEFSIPVDKTLQMFKAISPEVMYFNYAI